MNEKKRKDSNLKKRIEVDLDKNAGAVRETESRCLTVAIGTSAGGLEALEAFFRAMPPENGMSFIVIQHLSPDHASILPEILQRFTPMKVEQIENGMRILADRVHIIPPARDLYITDGVLQLKPQKKTGGVRLPIDLFFRSLSEDRKENAVCILLSGTGSDGTQGLKSIKAAGGMTMAQDGDARFSGMPQSAISTGLIDFILKAEEMPAKLLEIARERPVLPVSRDKMYVGADDEANLRRIFHLVRVETGHDFSPYKYSTILRRIERRMILHRIRTLEDYVGFLENNAAETKALFEEMLIGVTHFFRDPEAFELISKIVLPEIFSQKEAGETVRVWIPACSTGEEAYTIAILFSEYAASMERNTRIQIFCTDIDGDSLAVARKGVYPENIAADLSFERLSRFFDKEGGNFRVKKFLRDMLVIAPHSITRDPPFSRLDLVSCRNLLIYIAPDMQKKLVQLFHHSLATEGFLFLGPSETLGENGSYFKTFDAKWKIFRKQGTLPGTITDLGLFPIERPSFAGFTPRPGTAVEPNPVIREAERILFEDHVNPAFIVNGRYEALRFYGKLDRILSFSGEPTKNVLELARDELRLELRTAIHMAARDGTVVTRNDIVVKIDGLQSAFTITVRPLGRKDQAERFFLVVFEDTDRNGENGRKSAEPSGQDASVTRSLEEELTATRERLESIVEAYESSNEDLRSTNEEFLSLNEELQSSNEELETSREELQSLNEELSTVNQELQTKVDEVSKTNSDLNNFLGGTRIATLFLDRNLNIKRFTPQITEFFNLMDLDIGRPIADITRKIGYPSLVDDGRAVMETLESREKEIRAADGKWFMLRIVPYRTVTDSIEGAVVTFTDISALKETQEDLRKTRNEAIAARRAAETANRAKSDFLSNMSHEIRTPLTGIIGLTELAIPYAADEKMLSWLHGISESSRSLLSIVNDILDLSKIESGLFRLSEAPFDLRLLLDSVLMPLKVQAHDRGLSLDYEIDPSIYPIRWGDSQHLGQILINLVGNAVKFTEHGGILVTIRSDSSVQHQPGSGREFLLFSVRDTGPGIPAEKQQVIFEKFVQADSTPMKNHQGTGLGLSISRNLVLMMGGDIRLESRVGEGSTFSFSVFLARHEERKSDVPGGSADGAEPKTGMRTLRLLLAEDNRINRLFLEELLRRSGHEVTSTEDGIEAISTLERGAYDLAVLDISMPNMDGFEVIRKIRNGESNVDPHLPVVALTAYASPDDREKILAAGFDAFIPKPVESGKLEEAILRVVEKPEMPSSR